MVAARPPEVGHEAAQLSLAEVGVDVAPAQRGEVGRVDDVAADDRAAAVAAVRVGEDRFGRAARVRGAAVFFACRGRSPRRRPSRSWRRRPRRRAGSRAPRSGSGRRRRSRSAARRGRCRRRTGTGCAARSCRSRRGPRLADERVGGGDRVGPAARGQRVDPQQLAEQDILVLGVVGRIAAGAAVAGAEVEEVAEELQLAAVVVGVDRVGDVDHLAARAARGASLRSGGGIRRSGCCRRCPCNRRRSARCAGSRAGRRSRAARARLRRRRGRRCRGTGRCEPVAVAQHDDLAGLLDDEQQLREPGRPGHVDGAFEVADLAAARSGLAALGAGSSRRRGPLPGAPEAPQAESATRARKRTDDAGADAASHAQNATCCPSSACRFRRFRRSR